MSDLISFAYTSIPVRVILIDDQPWFVASDIASILGYRDAANMARNLDEDEKATHMVSTPGSDQPMTVISESGLYNAIFKSRRDEAQAFRKWVTADLLPTLRRTGRYSLADRAQPLVSADIDPPRIMAAVALANAARKLYGLATARRVWVQCGLPVAPEDRPGDDRADPLAATIAGWASDQDGFSIEECAAGVGIAEPDLSMRMRIGRVLRALGFARHTVRRGDRAVNIFVAAGA